jgi:hypothetical protein
MSPEPRLMNRPNPYFTSFAFRVFMIAPFRWKIGQNGQRCNTRVRIRYRSQKVTEAAMQIAEEKVWAQRS